MGFSIEKLWRKLKSFIAKKDSVNPKYFENIAIEDWQKPPAERFMKVLNGYKKHLEVVIVAKLLQPNFREGCQ